MDSTLDRRIFWNIILELKDEVTKINAGQISYIEMNQQKLLDSTDVPLGPMIFIQEITERKEQLLFKVL